MKYKPNRDLAEFAREAKTLSPSKLAEIVLNRRNEIVTPESVTMWFKRHPDVCQQLKKELVEGLPNEKEAVDQSIFQNGTFQTVQIVKDWILYMNTRRHKGKNLKPEYIKIRVQHLRFLCQAYVKHPARLTFRDAQEIFLDLEQKGKDSYMARTVLKDFLKSKGASEWEKIGVGKPRGFGKFADLFVEKPILLKMLEWIKTRDLKVYVADELMFHNGLRISAVQTAQIEKFKRGEKWDFITVLEKFREVRTFKLVKFVGDLIQQLIGERKEGLIFEGLPEDKAAEINRAALKVYCPDLEPKIQMPNHFWRHMCAQHLLRVTNRNSKAVAALMQCTEESLNESYGAATDSDVEKWENEYLPQM